MADEPDRPAASPSAPLPGRPVRGSATGRPIMALFDLLGRRWTLRIIWELAQEPAATFRELQQRCDGVSSSVLAQRLAELDQAAIVRRADRGYTLTPDGRTLCAELMRLETWADRWAARTAPAAE
ncbi:helix-turn-helix domain-containing protein [Spirillospora sp. NPDC000708]